MNSTGANSRRRAFAALWRAAKAEGSGEFFLSCLRDLLSSSHNQYYSCTQAKKRNN
jgi:hypothetical protein